ncbi:MAG: phosphate/phosphite/phosphonate ABC transporter substrate-binding protein [Candidatus Thiodiazotropha sp. DIVDIV]
MSNIPYRMTVSPDFTPDHISGWFIFNTWLQKALGLGIHLELYDSFSSQRRAIIENEIDLIYANPYDASMLVREKGFQPVARPSQYSDEAIIAVNKGYHAHQIEDLIKGLTIAATDDPDVNLICEIMLEPAGINIKNIKKINIGSYPLVAKALIQHKADLGFFLHDAYSSLSSLTKRQLRTLVSSEIQVIHHVLMVGPRLVTIKDALREALTGMIERPKGAGVLKAMNFTAWDAMENEEMEFMIDLMDTLSYQPE